MDSAFRFPIRFRGIGRDLVTRTKNASKASSEIQRFLKKSPYEMFLRLPGGVVSVGGCQVYFAGPWGLRCGLQKEGEA
jgi:hypothetical protein